MRERDTEPTLPRDAGGFTLLELLLGTGVLVVGSLGFLSLFGAATDVGRMSRETALAADGARRVLESLEAYEPQPLVALLHNSIAADDPVGWLPVDGIDGSGFAVDGLQPADNDVDGLAGEVVFPINPLTGAIQPGVTDEDARLFDDYVGRMRFGVAMADYELVPVIVRVRWSSRGMTRQHQVVGVLSPR